MKIQKEGGRVINLPDRLASKLVAKGKFKQADETFAKPAKKVKTTKRKTTKKVK